MAEEYLEDDTGPLERRLDLYKRILVIITVIIAILGFIWLVAYQIEKAGNTVECVTNPRLRYALPCGNEEDCIETCKRTLTSGFS